MAEALSVLLRLDKKKVYEYAVLLEITPNHLSETVQQTLNSSALSFIHKRILKEIEYLLSFSDISIKQIASALNFDSASQLKGPFADSYDPLLQEKKDRQSNGLFEVFLSG